jgi:two-component system cell cycle response regulator
MQGSDHDGDRGTWTRSSDNLSYRDIDAQMERFARNVEMNERLSLQLQQYELMLLEAASLAALLDILLRSTREHFELCGASLTLYDPRQIITELMPSGLDYGADLHLVTDSFDMQQRYGVRPEVEIVDVSALPDPQLLVCASEPATLVMLPLMRDGQLVGSFHWGCSERGAFASHGEREFMAHLAGIIAICLDNCVNAQRLSRLSLLDPVTRTGNARAFGMELRKEIARAQGHHKPLALLQIRVDEFPDINRRYGHLSGDYAIRAIATQIARMLRATDYIARSGLDQFALLLPACTEAKAQEVAERMRSEIEFMEIDDRRGANLFASLSVGLTCWSPKSYPAVNMEHLAEQVNNSAVQAMERAADLGGNRISVVRLTTMMV